ncbi:hypothetical protein [Paractinoplanes brasiliensis]|uniref:Type VII secretion system (Wss) protein ESAT-6 n=1 Tax=Paractinoplanes brasiliensis TaxID=52695 RepID=A0A4R6JUP0_9ACTN|nr:hypothetical protein [Actinoplanes brasiliensis]TDO39532.1 hypothetical protein C8E87_3223 [Actinoplanes brasiliensis]GID29129.1 hypothetical protein Abr02nite_41120 [Actinoplanes brasiliensis]
MVDPTAALVAPGEPDASAANGFPDPGALFNYVSPTAWINAVIDGLTGFNAIEYCTQWVGGDWGAIYKFGDALISMGQCADQLAVNLQQGMLKLDSGWDGNANDSAYNYFTSLSASVSELRFKLTDLGEEYHKAANGAWGLANQLGNLIQALADSAILAGIIAGGSTALMSTGVGAVVGGPGYVAVTLIVADMLVIVNKISVIIQTGMMAIFGSFGLAMDIAYQGGSLDSIPLPSAAYAAPGA